MFIVDGQLNIWAANTPERPWPADSHEPHRPLPLEKDELLREMDAAGVNRALLVPPSWQGDTNEVVLDAARQHPDRFAVMGRFDKDAPGARDRIPSWRKQQGMLGMRLTFRIEDSDDWLWAALEKSAVPIMIVAANQLATIDRVAARHPGLKLIVDHLAIPRRTKDDKAFAHIDELLKLAQRPNIAVKSSSLPSYTTDTYPYRLVHGYLRKVYDAFGPKRMFWGTDLSKLPCTYRQAVTMFTEELTWLTDEDKQWIMGRGICEWLGWALPAKA
jgi:L-fuconolactonase